MTAIEIACGLEYIAGPATESLLAEADEIAAMQVGLLRHLQKKRNKKTDESAQQL